MAHILLLTDLSDNSMHAAEYAVRLFGAHGNKYTLLHALADVPVDPYMAQWTTLESIKTSEEGLGLFANRLRERTGVDRMERRVIYGLLPMVMGDLVEKERIDLVVMGRRGEANALFFGSNAVDVVKHTRSAVLIVPGSAALTDVGRILLADDRREFQADDLAPLRRIAMLKKADVLVAHLEITGQEHKTTADQGLYDLALKDVVHTFTSAVGTDVAEGLEKLAHENRMDMIAVLHRHLNLVEGLFHRSAAKKMVLGTELPLLVLQHRGHSDRKEQ